MTAALTNTLNSTTSSTLTIRVIKNFEYRTVKNIVLQNVNLETTTVEQLKELIREKINTTPGFRPFRNVDYDTLKIYTKAHGAKTMNLVINFEHDEDWILNDEHSTLVSYGIENETEISFFNFEAYEKYKEHPDIQWD
ncbi:143_t:CDS:2 [Paraglomus occultum]|uniref:143_t:CDS:1 n=1 Tax=Paraglomus occultum TaxID=144539 RepID=A0A9N9C6S6_9GLOM|nr:143_t:CDS:2 [Paraglomus occultum]